MSRIRRRGLRPEPAEGWPLDRVLVGVATTRTIRELLRKDAENPGGPQRAWDLALWTGVSPGGSAHALDRLEDAGLVVALRPERPGRATGYRLDGRHPLTAPLIHLFSSERAMVRSRSGRPTWRTGASEATTAPEAGRATEAEGMTAETEG